MAGYKGSDASEWKVSAAARRDARNTLVIAEELRARPSGKKDTKRWCGGKVGREHEKAVGTYAETKGWRDNFADWQNLYCTRCGRELDHWVPRWSGRDKPEWAK